MKLLYHGLLYDYANPEQSYSYEFYNLQAGLQQCAEQGMFDLKIFNMDKEILESDKQIASEKFCGIVEEWKPDIIFDAAFDDNWTVDLDIFKRAKEKGIKVIFWGCDCSWRFNDFIMPRKNFYSHWISTHKSTIPWFEQNGMNVIKSQWGVSPLLKKYDKKGYKYDVSFVGQKHSIRGQLVQALNECGIKVHLWGKYFDGHPDYHGYATFEEMIDIFNCSKINLNFSNPFLTGSLSQVKGRAFELPGCGAFQITTPADNLEEYFVPNKEIVIVDSIYEMAQKIFYYLKHEEEREEIALSGYNRAVNDHIWRNRFKAIFNSL